MTEVKAPTQHARNEKLIIRNPEGSYIQILEELS